MGSMTQSADADTPTLERLGGGVFVRQEIDNIGWVLLGDEVLVVDALERPELEEEVFRLIRDTAGDRKVRYVLNTHTHYDHVALNGAFQSRHGARIVNASTTEIPDAGLSFGSKAHAVTMLPMPGCHTDSDCVVWMDRGRVLFVGDIFGWGLIPTGRALTAEVREHLVTTYERLIDMEPEHVVPGHGPLCTARELRRWVEYFHWLVEEVREREGDGHIDPPDDMAGWWRFLQWKHDDSVKKVCAAYSHGLL